MNDKEHLLLLAKKLAHKPSSDKDREISHLSDDDGKYVLKLIERIESGLPLQNDYPYL